MRLLLLFALISCSADVGQPQDVSLNEGWNRIETGGDTICSDGTDYHFFARPGTSGKLLVFFQGGGACWDGATCDTDLDPTYKVNLQGVNPAKSDGIFNFTNKRNPFQNDNMVFVPYCSGDVHIGNRVVTYEATTTRDHPSHQITTHHKGAVNANAVMEWVYQNHESPAAIFVTGSSAGSIPSPYYTVVLADHYPGARVTQLGDGSGGYRGQSEIVPQEIWGAMDIVADWPEYKGKAAADLTFEQLYIASAKRHPEITFAAYDTAEDRVQKRYLSLRNLDADSLLPNLDANQADIRGEVDNFRSFVAGGDLHTILRRPEFYRYHVDGIRVSDWVTELANTGKVDDVHCTECKSPQLIPEKMEDQ